MKNDTNTEIMENFMMVSSMIHKAVVTSLKDRGEETPPLPDCCEMPFPPPLIDKGREKTLCAIAENPHVNQAQLATILSVRPQSLSELITKMESDGCIKRVRDEKDRRQYELLLTPKGKKRAEEIMRIHGAVAEAVLARLDEKELSELLSILKKITGTEKHDDE